MFYGKRVLRNFTKFTGKHLCQSLRPATLLNKRLLHSCFTVNFAKFLRTPFLQNTSRRLLLNLSLRWWIFRSSCSQMFFKIRVLKKSLLNCVPCVLKTCSYANVPCVLTCSRANMSCVPTCLRANTPCVLTCSRANMPCVLMYSCVLRAYVLTCSRVNVPCELTCSCVNVPSSITLIYI